MTTRTPATRRTTSTTAAAKPATRPPAPAPATTPRAVTKTVKKDEFSTGRARALRAKALGAVTGPTASGAPRLEPVHSFDTATYLSIVGNPPQHRITQQQVDTLRQQGMKHGVIGMPNPKSPTFAVETAALAQELKLLNANGIRTDTYSYLKWTKNGVARTDADVRDQLFKSLDTLKGQPVKTFWLDVEFDPKLNPPAGVENHQRILDTAYKAFNDWKTANPDSKLEFGIYSGSGMWDHMSKGPNDPFNTKYADLGVPLWEARYSADYAPADIANGLADMQSHLPGFGGWSVAEGNVRGWQYRAGEHDGYLPAFTHGLDRNVWLQDANEPAPPITAIPSGFRADLPIANPALYALIKQDQGKPVDQRKFKTLQDLINANGKNGVTFKNLGVNENACYQNRWEDPWKLVHGLPLGTDQFSTQPLPPAPVTPTPVPVTPTPVPVTPVPVPVTPVPVTPTPVAGSPLDLLNLKRGATDPTKVQQLQDTLMSLGYLADIKSNAGYGKAFGPVTETALKAFQKAQQLTQTGVVDRATVAALATATHTSLGFDTTSPFAAAFGLTRGANATGDRPGLKALQDALISGGYVPASMKTQAGYGTNFGPLTAAGLTAFQAENGLNPSGVVDAATITALGNPRARPAGFAAGLAVTHRAQLGLPKGPAYTAADGSLRQDFDRGSVWVTAENVLHAEAQTNAGMQELMPPRKLGTAQSLEEARASFLTQWGPSLYNDPPTGSDVPYGYYDCGPTSALMALAALGITSRPGAAEAAGAIDHMRDQILGYDSNKSLGLGLLPAVKGTVGYGLVAAGAQVTGLHNTLTDLDAALARGNPVIIGSGTTWAAWGQAERTAGNYLNGGNPSGHFVTVLGRSANGNYLIGDPLVKGGPIEVTAAQVQTALNGAFNSANALAEVSRPE